MRRAVFLDRDGVLNVPMPLGEWVMKDDDFVLYDVEGELQRLVSCGFVLLVVTNQSCIFRKLISSSEMDGMHQRKMGHLPISKIYVCPHKPDDGCPCRKPAPGLLLRAKEEFDLDLDGSYLVGDNDVDIEAGEVVGVTSIKISPGGLKDAVDYIIGMETGEDRPMP